MRNEARLLRDRSWSSGPRLHTYVLDIIGSYCLVVDVDGSLSNNNDVQPFLIRTVLKGYTSEILMENFCR